MLLQQCITLDCTVGRCGLHSSKRSLMSWVSVIPKEGRGPSFGLTLTFPKKKKQKFSTTKKKNISKNSKKSVSYQKKGGRGHARPSFFWYDTYSGHKEPFRVTRPMCGAVCLASEAWSVTHTDLINQPCSSTCNTVLSLIKAPLLIESPPNFKGQFLLYIMFVLDNGLNLI